jgi:hypothetical protein
MVGVDMDPGRLFVYPVFSPFHALLDKVELAGSKN